MAKVTKQQTFFYFNYFKLKYLFWFLGVTVLFTSHSESPLQFPCRTESVFCEHIFTMEKM